MCDLVHDMETVFAVSRALLIFQERFQDAVNSTVNEGRIKSPHSHHALSLTKRFSQV